MERTCRNISPKSAMYSSEIPSTDFMLFRRVVSCCTYPSTNPGTATPPRAKSNGPPGTSESSFLRAGGIAATALEIIPPLTSRTRPTTWIEPSLSRRMPVAASDSSLSVASGICL